MLVDPMIVSRPGENGCPSGGACQFTGVSHEGDGPYACYMGKYYSVGAARDLARAFGILASDEAHQKFERLLAELSTVRATVTEQAGRITAQDGERSELLDELESAREEILELRSSLVRANAAAEISAEYFSKPAPPVKRTTSKEKKAA
jgi:hypothetical protein